MFHKGERWNFILLGVNYILLAWRFCLHGVVCTDRTQEIEEEEEERTKEEAESS